MNETEVAALRLIVREELQRVFQSITAETPPSF
jgi:hypothetical protein